MGVLLKWKKPTTESNYNQARIWRSDDKIGTYTNIASQTIADNSYYDPNGKGEYWYKVDFYDSVNGIASNMSDPLQGGVYYGYCTVDDIRIVTNIKPSQISDTQLANLIEFAASQLNADINVHHEEEAITYIDATKENKLDGENSTYWTKHYPIGDRNDDYKITVTDVRVYQVTSIGDKSELTVTQIDSETGEFHLDVAPTSDKLLYVTYKSTQRVVDPVHQLIKTACILLTAAWAYSKINVGKADRFHMGNITVFRDTDSHHDYYKRYIRLLTLINDRSITDYTEAENIF